MRDAKIRFGLHDDRLWRDTASPIDGHFARGDFNRIAKVRHVNVGNADQRRITKVYRCAMYGRDLRCHLYCPDGIGRTHRTHRNHHRAMEGASGDSGDIGLVHGDIQASLNMTQGDAGVNQGLFKGKGAANGKSDQIVTPQRRNVGALIGLSAIAPDAITRDIGADVEVCAQSGQAGIARFGYGKQRTGFGVALAETQKVIGQLFRQDDNVCLDKIGCDAAGVTSPGASPDDMTCFDACFGGEETVFCQCAAVHFRLLGGAVLC